MNLDTGAALMGFETEELHSDALFLLQTSLDYQDQMLFALEKIDQFSQKVVADHWIVSADDLKQSAAAVATDESVVDTVLDKTVNDFV